MKPRLTQIALRLQALRRSRHQTQQSLAARCRHYGFPVSRTMLAKYEIGLQNIPAQFIPIVAHALNVEITDLLPPIGDRAEPEFTPELLEAGNLTGRKIRFFRIERKWTQEKLAEALQKMSLPITRQIIANIETQRTLVTDRQLFFVASALRIPVSSLFPCGTGTAHATHVLPDPTPEKLPPARRDHSHFTQNPFAALTHKIRRLVKRVVIRR